MPLMPYFRCRRHTRRATLPMLVDAPPMLFRCRCRRFYCRFTMMFSPIFFASDDLYLYAQQT